MISIMCELILYGHSIQLGCCFFFFFGISLEMLLSAIAKIVCKFWLIIADLVGLRADLSPQFSPFIICVLEKCLKVIRPKSGFCSLPKKSMVLLYTCNTVKYLLQTQVHNTSLYIFA